MDMPIRIFCEGVSDQRFLRDFLKVHYGIIISDDDLKKNRFIENMGSWNKLKTLDLKITETYSDYTSLIFLDADDEKVVEKAGFQATISLVNNLMNDWNWTKYDLFVLPNHQNSGTIEDLLENIINKENAQIFDCWKDFEMCLSNDKSLTIPAKKSKIYSYLECLHSTTNQEKDKCKDQFRDFKDPKLWDISNLQNPYIKRVKDFFDKYIQ